MHQSRQEEIQYFTYLLGISCFGSANVRGGTQTAPGLTASKLSASYFLQSIRLIPLKTKWFNIHCLTLTEKH